MGDNAGTTDDNAGNTDDNAGTTDDNAANADKDADKDANADKDADAAKKEKYCKKIFCGEGEVADGQVKGEGDECPNNNDDTKNKVASGTTLTISSLIVFLSAFYY